MAARKIQLVFGKFVRIIPELFTTAVRIVKGTTETVIVDAAEQEIRNWAQDIRPSNHQGENSSQSRKYTEITQSTFKNDQ
jgi:hypothetical protein